MQQGEIVINYFLTKKFSIFDWYPENLTVAIAKIGGLVAIFKFGMFL
jgi:hypothetical protein